MKIKDCIKRTNKKFKTLLLNVYILMMKNIAKAKKGETSVTRFSQRFGS